jgi:HlyD family secretion protein
MSSQNITFRSSVRLLVLACAICFGLLSAACSETTAQNSAPSNPKDVISLEKVDYPVLVMASGILQAEQNVSITPPKVRQVHRFRISRIVDEGTEVNEGDFLVEFDASEIDRTLRNQTANYQRVQQEYQKKRSEFEVQMGELRLQLEQAKADLEKLENKLSQQMELESRIQVEETRLRRDVARKRYQLLQEKITATEEAGRLNLQLSRSNENNYKEHIDRSQDAIDSMLVRAPVPGMVIYRRDWNGEPRKVGSDVFIMDTVIDLPDMKTLRVKAMIDEVDASKVRIGLPTKVQIDAVPGLVLDGEISAVSDILKQASYDRPQKVAELFIQLKNALVNKQIRPGMSTKAQIQVDMHKGVIAIPLSAILGREGRSYVQVLGSDKKKTELREIQIEYSDAMNVVVASGLQAGETIRSKPSWAQRS